MIKINTVSPRKKILFFAAIFSVLAISASAAVLYFKPTLLGHKPIPSAKPQKGLDQSRIPAEPFAVYSEEPSTVKPSLPNYPVDVTKLQNLTAVSADDKFEVDAAKKSALEKDGFFTRTADIKTSANPDDTITYRFDSPRVDDMIDMYKHIGGGNQYERKPENTVFITSDFLLHIYHVLIDRTVQKIEEVSFHPTLTQLTEHLYTDALGLYQSSTDSAVKESYRRITTYFLVPLAILKTSAAPSPDYFEEDNPQEKEDKSLKADQSSDSDDAIMKKVQTVGSGAPDDIRKLAVDELKLLLDADHKSVSPLYASLKPDSFEDYTQYKPRGHYTKSSALRSYFRSMMWFGRHGFEIKNPSLTRDAILTSWLLSNGSSNGKSYLSNWESVYQPTVFFVGQSDDLSVYEYSKLTLGLFGTNFIPQMTADETKLTKFREEAAKLKGPKILSEIIIIDPVNPPTKDELLNSTKGFRFMGQRFIPDSYMFSKLTQGAEQKDEVTGQSLPSTPTALMIMSLLGSKTADTQLSSWIKQNAPNSDKVIAKEMKALKTELEGFDKNTWTQNIYWSWLYNLKPLFDSFGNGYPMFMTTPSWGNKNLQTALGSWTQLRHDTLLYAKQSYAEMGGMMPEGEIPPVPKGYVEPNLSFLTRLRALSKLTLVGFENRKLLVPGQQEKFEDFEKALVFFQKIAEQELTNSVISDEDFEKLRTIVSSEFPRIIWSLDGDVMTEKDARMGIIADVHTDAINNSILYEAIGKPSIIYVAVSDSNGSRLTRGAVYSYYEFSGPLESRLSDEDWQKRVYNTSNENKLPDPPGWTKDMVSP